MTLGAETRQVILLVMREGMGLVVVGAILGILLSALLSVPLSAILYGITPLDPLVLGGILLVLLTIAALASYIPARRLTKFSLISTLRYE